ncbi:MAG: hypothetical protein CME68_04920 [Halobacteriovoraceae bacterium]|nr:hypothetical protein [Halobacteriovoraceae bacterium]
MDWMVILNFLILILTLFSFLSTLASLEKLQFNIINKSYFLKTRTAVSSNFLFDLCKSLFKKSMDKEKPYQNISFLCSLIAIFFSICPFLLFSLSFEIESLTKFQVVLKPGNPLTLMYFLVSFLLGLFPILVDSWVCGKGFSYIASTREFIWRFVLAITLFFLVISSFLSDKGPETLQYLPFEEINNFWKGLNWGVFKQPIGSVVFFICLTLCLARKNHFGFSSTGTRSVIKEIGSYHNALSFNIFKLSDNLNYLGFLLLFVFLYLGGWSSHSVLDQMIQKPFLLFFLKGILLLVKTSIVHLLVFGVYLSIPSLKWKHAVKVSLRYLLPISVFNLVLTLVWLYTYKGTSL